MDWVPDLRQLRAFVAVADEGSFTLAAKRLFLTQSAISHSLKALESQLDCKLLDREGKRVTLTAEGDVLLKRCRNILNELDRASRDLDGLKRWGQARLRVGAPHSLCHFLLPTVLREFRDCFPRCETVIVAGDTGVLRERLDQGELDLMIGLKTGAEINEGVRPLFDDEMAFVVAPVHPWATGAPVDAESLAEHQFIIYARATETHRLVEEWFLQRNVRTKGLIVLGDMEAIKEMARIGIGVGIVAPWVAAREVQDGSLALVSSGDPPIRREWAIFHQERRQPTLVEETFMGICSIVSENLLKSCREEVPVSAWSV